MFIIPALVALAAETHRVSGASVHDGQKFSVGWLFYGIFLVLIIGFRVEVGGDWFNYLRYLDGVAIFPIDEIPRMSDPGYFVINWICSYFNLDIYGVNLISGLIFSVGLIVFCLSLARPWLALAISIPYLVIVVAMGYSRQGVALGLAMFGLVYLQKKEIGKFIFLVILGAAFHKTAVLMLPIAALASARNRLLALVWGGGALVLGYFLFLEDSAEILYENYIEAEYQSSGAQIRLIMNLLPASCLILFWKRFAMDMAEKRLWIVFALISFALFFVLMISPSSTAVDRIALYMLPLQMVVFSNFPDIFSDEANGDVVFPVMLVIAYYALVEFVWLNYAVNAGDWIPYRFYPLEALF